MQLAKATHGRAYVVSSAVTVCTRLSQPSPRGRLFSLLLFSLLAPCWLPPLQWCCMPQGKRTAEEEAEFSRMLPQINVLYLGMQCLLVLDMSYASRFW